MSKLTSWDSWYDVANFYLDYIINSEGSDRDSYIEAYVHLIVDEPKVGGTRLKDMGKQHLDYDHKVDFTLLK